MLLAKLQRKFENPVTHVELGRLFQAEGRLDDADYHYSLALRFDPVYWPAQAAIVKLLQERGKNSEADVAGKLYITQVAGSTERSIELGDAFNQAKIDKFALECYAQALRLGPKSAVAHKKLGYYYLERSDNIRAREYLKQSYNLDWNQPDVAYRLGDLGVQIVLKTKGDLKDKPGG